MAWTRLAASYSIVTGTGLSSINIDWGQVLPVGTYVMINRITVAQGISSSLDDEYANGLQLTTGGETFLSNPFYSSYKLVDDTFFWGSTYFPNDKAFAWTRGYVVKYASRYTNYDAPALSSLTATKVRSYYVAIAMAPPSGSAVVANSFLPYGLYYPNTSDFGANGYDGNSNAGFGNGVNAVGGNDALVFSALVAWDALGIGDITELYGPPYYNYIHDGSSAGFRVYSEWNEVYSGSIQNNFLIDAPTPLGTPFALANLLVAPVHAIAVSEADDVISTVATIDHELVIGVEPDQHHTEVHALYGPAHLGGLFYKEGSGVTISDADFTTPANGLLAVTYDTRTGVRLLWARSNGAWKAVEA